MLVSANLATGDSTIGPAYLLPAFSAAFLSSTQLRAVRFNVWGTVVAVIILATGVKELQLAGAPIWIPRRPPGRPGQSRRRGNERLTCTTSRRPPDLSDPRC